MESKIENIYTFIMNSRVSWPGFFVALIAILLLYFFLKFLQKSLNQIQFRTKAGRRLQSGIYYLLLVYEPLAAIVLANLFILIHPLIHGLTLGVVFLLGFRHVRNYLTGKLMRLDKNFSLGNKLRSGPVNGIIAHVGRFGVYIQTREGRHFITYLHLMQQGYTFTPSDDVGGFYHLQLTPKQQFPHISHRVRLMDLLTTAPYLDWKYKPELITLPDHPDELQIKVLVKEEIHLSELIALMEEWGYSTRIIKN
ncbi:MAG: hypothetical protein D6730_16160 [Bacteroidetes bacterium]|nr:MAG: hypothetical protein D6730_16160 [Bacteroidota bacterium]